MENLKQQFQEKLLSTKRDGMENVIKHLERLGFFTAPASTKFHLSVKAVSWSTRGMFATQLSCYANK